MHGLTQSFHDLKRSFPRVMQLSGSTTRNGCRVQPHRFAWTKWLPMGFFVVQLFLPSMFGLTLFPHNAYASCKTTFRLCAYSVVVCDTIWLVPYIRSIGSVTSITHVLKCYETISHVNNAQESPCFHQPWPRVCNLPCIRKIDFSEYF